MSRLHHRAFGHCGHRIIIKTLGAELAGEAFEGYCKSCIMGKRRRQPHKKVKHLPVMPGILDVTIDVAYTKSNQMPNKGYSQWCRYSLIIRCRNSGAMWYFTLMLRGEVKTILINWMRVTTVKLRSVGRGGMIRSMRSTDSEAQHHGVYKCMTELGIEQAHAPPDHSQALGG